jgi:TolA-binding protein
MNRKRDRFLASLLAGTFYLGLAASFAADACSWENTSQHSVRFYGTGAARAFRRLPMLPISPHPEAEKLFHWGDDLYYEYDSPGETNRIEEVWSDIKSAEASSDLQTEKSLLEEYLKLTRGLREGDQFYGKELQERRNSAYDKLDAMSALQQAAPPEIVHQYLIARTAYDEAQPPYAIGQYLAPCRKDKRLIDNAAYLEAAVFERDRQSIGFDSFAEVAKRFPRSEKREAALFMDAVVSMRGGYDRGSRMLVDPLIVPARRGFQRVLREYPNGRYSADAMGWSARLSLLEDDRVAALAGYYRMLASDNESAREEAASSLRFVRRKATVETMTALEKKIEDEPRVALAYAYYEIYNYALWHRCDPGGADYFKPHCDKDRGDREVRRIGEFAGRMMRRYPGVAVSAGFALRLAEIDLELENNLDASMLAKRALAMGLKGDQRAEGLWVGAAADHELKRYASARKMLEVLVRENPDNRYTEGARRRLAMVLEDMGDTFGALEQYLALDYRHDVAYFVDVLMSPDELATYIAKRPGERRRNELLYALGVRYMRDRRWEDARRIFAQVKTLGRDVDDNYFYRAEIRTWETPIDKTTQVDPLISGVRVQWLEQDLRTIDDIERLERAVNEARDDEPRAEALYQVASYQYQRSLLFHNAAAWDSNRHYLLTELDSTGAFRRPGEAQLLFDDIQKHDMASNSLPIFLEVVRRFPNTRAARDALYTAAVCHERLRNYNEYWTKIYDAGGHAGPAMITFGDVKKMYAQYHLPRGTFGWEPSTRTVNGGPAWDTPPRIHVQRPSRWERIKPYLDFLANDVRRATWLLFDLVSKLLMLVTSWVYHLSCASLAAFGLWFIWPNASEARRQLFEALATCQPAEQDYTNPVDEEPVLCIGRSSSSYKTFLRLDARDAFRRQAREFLYLLKQLDEDGRSALTRTIVGHFLSVLLFFALLSHIGDL